MSDLETYILNNPVEVIDKFGGIRPMATRLEVAPTTVQGWKSRQSIPKSRVKEIIKVANENNIHLQDGGAVDTPLKPDTGKEEAPVKSEKAVQKDEPAKTGATATGTATAASASKEITKEKTETSDASKPEATPEADEPVTDKPEAVETDKAEKDKSFTDTLDQLAAGETKSETKREAPSHSRADAEAAFTSLPKDEEPPKINLIGWVVTAFIITLIIVGIAVLWPMRGELMDKGRDFAARNGLTQNMQQAAQPEEEPETNMAGDAGRNAADAPVSGETNAPQPAEDTETSELSGEEETSTSAEEEQAQTETEELESRLNDLEQQMETLLSSEQIQEIMNKYEELEQTTEGNEQLDRAAGQLGGIVESLDGRMDLLPEALVIARENSTTLGETFDEMNERDLKPAAFVLGLRELRTALNEGDTPFAGELNLVRGMLSSEKADLRRALARLEPFAESGIATPATLSEELETLSEEISNADLGANDTSIGEQAQGRLSKVLSVKKDGEQISGTATQRTLSRAQKALGEGNMQPALQAMQTLEGPAAVEAAPFIEKVRAAMVAEKVSASITTILDSRAASGQEGQGKTSSSLEKTGDDGGLAPEGTTNDNGRRFRDLNINTDDN